MNRFGMHGKLTAHPGQREALLRQMLTAAELVSGAPGCYLYVVALSPSDRDVLWVTEAWRSRADHDASLSIPGVKELIAKARPLIAAMSDQVITIPVGGKGIPEVGER
jgi:quinol monooxygenase YgiN